MSIVEHIIRSTISFNIAKSISNILFFIAVWFSLWFVYGNVLFQLQENSLWLFIAPSKCESLDLPSDYLTYISRFFLTIFKIKWLGSLFVTLVLYVIQQLTGYIIKIKTKFYFVSYIPSVILLLIIFSCSYDIYFEHEDSTIIKILLLSLIGFVTISLVVSMFRNIKSERSKSTITFKTFFANISFIVIFLVSSVLYATRDDEFMRLASIKYNASIQNWKRVARIAEQSKQPTPMVAAYHAASISQLGQIGERLFRISHDYDYSYNTSLSSIPLKYYLGAGLLYAPELYLNIGLVQPAYHYSMENMVMSGKYKGYLKVMVVSAILKHETELADKLLEILSRAPFEADFVSKYRFLNENPMAITQDPKLAPIIELVSMDDSFEQAYQQPLFLSYFSNLNDGSERVADISLSSCLYQKDLNGFKSRYSALMSRKNLPRHFQEALVMMYKLSNVEAFLSNFNISLEVFNNVTDFYNELGLHSKDKDRGKSSLKKRFGKTYMYYYTFENLTRK